MLIYWTIFLLLASAALLNREHEPGLRMPLWLFGMLPIALMIGLRWQIGPDWVSYLDIFNYSRFFSLGQSLTHSDPGFFTLLWVLHEFSAPFWVENMVCGLVFGAGLTAFCSRQSNPWLALIVAFPYLVIVIAMSGNRQSLALGFLFFALIAFERHQVVRFVVLTFIAAMFHASAILMLPIGLLSFTSNGPLRALLLIVCAVTGVYLLGFAFGTYARRYSLDKLQSAGIWYRLAMNGLPALVFLRFQKLFGFAEHERILWRNVSLLSLAAVVLVFLLPSSTAVDRIILYFFPLQFAVLSRVPYLTSVERKTVGTSILAIIAYAAAIQIVFLNFGNFSGAYVPYKSILQR